MRLFVGIDLPKAIKDELFSVQEQFSPKLAKIKWVSKKNLHLTLKFLNQVDESYVGEIKKRLKRIEFDSFEVKLSKLGVFPGWHNVRVIWVGLLPEKKAIGLQQKVDAELLDLFKFDQRFSPHLTLGRVKFVKNKKDFVLKLKNTLVNGGKFKINKFSLIRSVLNKNGPVYEVLESFYAKANI